ncbi:hypothetical protein MesoLjLc_50310 [Mesorhizobium sp. L-8-10]|nr:hypothetical protein MesoLjLc_50310 [Mesorhizobium sp. L-8-10]
MEEILASIRRIIEDSDQGRKPVEADLQGRFDVANERNEAAVIEVDAFRAELRGRIDRDHDLRQSEVKDEAQLAVASAPEAAPDLEPLYAAGESARPAALTEARPSLEPFEDEIQAAVEDTLPEAVPLPEAVKPAAATPQPEAAEPPAPPVARPAIISEQAGRQVAAAFGELSEAFAASRRKSFDEMAEEMLRPMLQDWLDNNLPTLVERLVREEIERVARGG